MAYTFRIHKDTPGQIDGWQETAELAKGSDPNSGIGSINDSIEGGNAGKVGTSIPTPFARVYLFDTAYTFVATNKGSRDPNFYDQLVTQSLDLLQLIFEKGADPKLKLYEWNGPSQVKDLFDQGFKEGHKILATALNSCIKSNGSRKDGSSNNYLQSIILVEYDGVLLGGTSPMTLTYTSPNAIRLLREKDIELFANDKSQLFKERSVKHLNRRSREFQRYVAWLVRNNSQEFSGDNKPLNTFYNYITSQNLSISEEELSSVDESYYPRVRRRSSLASGDVGLSIYGDLALRFNDEPMDMRECDFLMRPSIKAYGGGLVPVVLPTDGDSTYDGWRYTKNETWQSLTIVDYYVIESTGIKDRHLPTNGARSQLTTNKYPWLTTGDFFEGSLISLGFNLNKDRFFFPETGDKTSPQFLLPIRKEYFKYFELSDLQDCLRCFVEMNPRREGEVSSVTFELKIKLQNKDYLTLRRTYRMPKSGERVEYPIVNLMDGFSFGVFPFYRCPVQDDKKNEYSIYLYGSSSDENFAKLSFYKQDFDREDLIRVVDSETRGEGLGVIRTKTGETGYSRVYNLRNETSNSFDFIEVDIFEKQTQQACRGIAAPIWFKLPIVNNNKEAILSIDFGTTNTYISYLEDGSAKPLVIGLEDQQMVLLNDSCKKHGTEKRQFRNQGNFGDAQYMSQYLREFVPSIIGEHSVDEDEYIEYPIKTATIEKQNFQSKDKLFSSISVGFNIDNEKTQVDEALFTYKTNLKWSAEEHKGHQDEHGNLAEFNKDESRIQAFCDQTLWMLKNKLVMKGYSSHVKIMYFYPDSMSDVGRKIFKDAWEAAVKSILIDRGFDVELKEELEAISPYYSLLILHGNKIYSKSTANIDIGGGTTDFFILDQSHMDISSAGSESGKAYEASIFFAGNDLWGATYPQSESHGRYQENGFVNYMKSLVPVCDREAQQLFASYGKEKGMADFSGFFFKNDHLFKFSDKISGNEKFRFVVFLHYAAIIFHFAEMLKLIKAKDPAFRYPEILTFTGKGSEYLKIINMMTNNVGPLSEMTTKLIQAFGIEDFKGLQVIQVTNPKALTADGGIYELMSNSELRINLFDKDAFGATKSTTVTNTPYERIGKICLGLPIIEGHVYKKRDVKDVEPQALSYFKKYADAVFFSPLLTETRRYLKVNLIDEDYDVFIKYAQDSYEVHSARFLRSNIESADNELEESVFFFALKNALINMSLFYFGKLKK